MSNDRSTNDHSPIYGLFSLIALICALFYWFNAQDSVLQRASSEPAAFYTAARREALTHVGAVQLPGNYQMPAPETNIESLSLADYAMLQNLPSICVAEVPGIKDEDKPGCPATDALAQVEQQTIELAPSEPTRAVTRTVPDSFESTGQGAFAEAAPAVVPISQQPAPRFTAPRFTATDNLPFRERQRREPQPPRKPQLELTSNESGQPRVIAAPDTRQASLASAASVGEGDQVGRVANALFEREDVATPESNAAEQAIYQQALAQATTRLARSSSQSTSNQTQVRPVQPIQLASYEEEAHSQPALNPHAKSKAGHKPSEDFKEAKQKLDQEGIDPHLEAFSRSAYPSAVECSKCHEQIFEEWASSSHAYASISPMFHVFEERINKLSQGTIGYFCMRCHAPVATTMGLRRDQAIWDGPRVFREGVTCIACHRVKTPYGKTNGERHMTPGGVTDPIVGGSDGKGVHLAADKYADWFKTKTDPESKKPGQLIHGRSIQFEELSKSSYCISCHQVAVEPGIKLEVVWDQYRASPAYREGTTCQECHMGAVPGVAAGYSFGPAAVVDGKVVNPERKHSNHMFYGPGYSIAHPGLFPQTVAADRWDVNQWLAFDWRAGWGSKEFEKQVAGDGVGYFPHPWDDADARMDAREIVDANLKKLDYKKDLRVQLLENGSKLDGPFFPDRPGLGQRLNFRYCLTNINPGHNMPSGSLGAQPQIWMNVVLSGPDGQRLWETGYLDSNGDLCDNHSLDVLARRAPMDDQLLNLQTKFLVTNVKGTEREMYLPVPYEQDQLPFLRPAPQPISVLNHPVGIRMEGHSLPPLGSRNIKYSVPAELITQPGTYSLSVRLRSRAEPIYFMRFCNATPEMMRMMNEWIADFHEQTVVFEVR